MPKYDDHDDLAALDFSTTMPSDDDGMGESDALNFSVADDSAEDSVADVFDDFAPVEPDDRDIETELEALASVTEVSGEDEDGDEDDDLSLYTVTNPPGTVSVSALIDGRTQRVKLSAKAKNMTESELAEEIIVLSELARQKGLAGQRTLVMESASQNEGLQQLSDAGFDSNQLLQDFVETGMQLPTQEQADAAQAEVFATRYTADK
jgi:hypothetical protein